MSIFKDSFSPNIKHQLYHRQNAINDRTPTNLQYYNSRNAWIRMSSSVNIYNGSGDVLNPSNYSNQLASSNILQGGTLSPKNSLRSGIGDNSQAYSNLSSDGTNYRLGIRPMAGITNIDIKSKGAYGSLREATVHFQCWDIKQLEDLELLYMRPGYSVLLEWGWSPHFDENEKYITTIDPYDIITTQKPKEQIWKELDEKMAKNGNYEAMFGFVKNYNWVARMDGGYDCTTNIISFGEIVESLKINYTPSIALDTIKTNGLLKPNISILEPKTAKVEFNIFKAIKDLLQFGITTTVALDYMLSDVEQLALEANYEKNILAGLMFELAQIIHKADPNTQDKGEKIILADTKYNSIYNCFYQSIEINGDGKQNEVFGGGRQYYISLDSLCTLLNNYVLLRDQKSNTTLVELSVLEKDYVGTPNNETGEGYLKALAHPLQISIDPTVCLIKNDLWVNGMKISVGPTTTQTGASLITFNSNLKSMPYASTPKEFIETLIRNTIPVTYTDSNASKKIIAKFIKDYIQGPNGELQNNLKENLKEITSTFNDLYKTYSIQPPNLSSSWGLKYTNPSSIGKTLYGGYSTTNTFYDLLEDMVGANLDKKTINDILGGEKNTDNIADSDPKKDEQERIDELSKTLQEDIEEGKEGIKFISNLPKPYFVSDTTSTPNQKPQPKELGIIGNIFVNINMLYHLANDTSLSSQDKKQKNDIVLYDFIKNILSKISTSIGEVNNFDLFVEPNGKTIRIIDINYTGEPKDDYANAAIIQLQNLHSIVRSYKLESKIFPEQSTQIAIGAQIGGGALGTDATTLVSYNRKIIDRIIPVKDMPTSSLIPDDINAKKTELIKNITSIYKYFSEYKNNAISKSDFDIDKVNAYRNALKDLINFFKSISNSKTNNRAIIPTVLSLDMDGLGGIIIGNILRIPDEILPKGYKGDEVGIKLGYVVTGLGHTVNNDWVTKIDAQTIILDGENNPNLLDIDYYNIEIDLASGKNILNPISIITKPLSTTIPLVNKNSSTGGATKVINGIIRKNGNVEDLLVSMRPDLYKRHNNSGFNNSDEGRVRLQAKAMQNLEKLLNDSYTEGIYFKINSAYRTKSDQDRVWNSNCSNSIGSGKCIARPGKSPAATPGTSNHGFGLAVDLANSGGTRIKPGMKEYTWIQANKYKYGFKEQNQGNESHHYNFLG